MASNNAASSADDDLARYLKPRGPDPLASYLKPKTESIGESLKAGAAHAAHEAAQAGLLLTEPFAKGLDLVASEANTLLPAGVTAAVGHSLQTDRAETVMEAAKEQGDVAQTLAAAPRTLGGKVAFVAGDLVGKAVEVIVSPAMLASQVGVSRAAQGIESGESATQALLAGGVVGAEMYAGMKVPMGGTLAKQAAKAAGLAITLPVADSALEHLIDPRLPAVPSLQDMAINLALFETPVGARGLAQGIARLRTPKTPATEPIAENTGIEVSSLHPVAEKELGEYQRGFAQAHQHVLAIRSGQAHEPAHENAPNFERGWLDGLMDTQANLAGRPSPERLGVLFTHSPEAVDYAKLAKEGKYGALDSMQDYAHSLKRGWRLAFPVTSKNEFTHDLISRQVAKGNYESVKRNMDIQVARSTLARLPEAEQLRIYDYTQRGDTLESFPAESRDAIRSLRNMADTLHAEAEGLGIESEFRENYLPQYFANAPQTPHFEAFVRTLSTGAKYRNERFFDLVSDALKYRYPGRPDFRLKLRSFNPADNMAVRMADHVRLSNQVKILNTLSEYGHLRPVEAEADLHPGEMLLRSASGQHYAVPEGIQSLLHNRLFGQSLWQDKTWKGQLFRAAMEVKMITSPVLLSLSAYHLLHEVLGLRAASGMAEGFQAARGKPFSIQSATDVGKALAAQLSLLGETGPKTLKHIRDALMGKPVDLDESQAQLLNYLMDSGFKMELSREYHAHAGESFIHALQDRKFLKGMGHLIPAAFRSLQYPIMDFAVPYLKLQAMTDGISHLLTQHPELVNDEAARVKMFSALRRNVDQRFGQMPYDTLGWNRRISEAMQVAFLSFSWQYGFVKQFGGAALDAARLLGRTVSPKLAEQEIGSRLLFSTLYIAQAALIGGMMTELLGGRRPTTIKDYLYPDVGNGKRVNTMFFTRDFGALYYHYKVEGLPGLERMLADKSNPTLSMLADQIQNRNFYDQQIYDPQAPFDTQLLQRAKAAWEGMEPIALSSTAESQHLSVRDKVLAFAGFTPAPSYVERPVLAQQIYYLSGLYNQHLTPYRKVEEQQDTRNLRHLWESGNRAEFERQLPIVGQKYGWNEAKLKRFIGSFYKPPAAETFKRLPWDVQVKLIQGMTPEQRLEYEPYASKDARAALAE